MIEQVKVTKDMIRRAQKYKAELNKHLNCINETPITLLAAILETTEVGKKIGYKPSPITQSEFVDYAKPSDKQSLKDQEPTSLAVATVLFVLVMLAFAWVGVL